MKTSQIRIELPRYWMLLFYFFSGTSALMYEIVWARMLGQIVGTAVTAWAAVLVAYMGGMALGSFAGGRITDQIRRPLLVFALCEFGIGLFGIASPVFMHGIKLFCVVLPTFPGQQTVVAVLVLIVPTMLMGATFPLISRAFVAGTRPLGSDVGIVYSANVFGAISGTLAAGFFLMPAFGMSASLRVAAVINFAVALGALLFLRVWRDGSGVEYVERKSRPSLGILQVPAWLFPAVLASSGFCTMAFEVLWSRALVFFLTSTTYSFTVVLSVMLVGLAGGGLAATIMAKKGRYAAWVSVLQLVIGAYGFVSIFFLQGLDAIIHFNEGQTTHVWWYWIGMRYAACIAVLLPPAFCMGATYPLAIGAACRSFETMGRSIGFLASLNTIGGIAGSLAAALVLIPVAGIQRSLLIVAMLNGFAGLSVMGWGIRRFRKWAVGGAFALLLVFAAVATLFEIHPMILYRQALRNVHDAVSVISYKEDRTASVAVLESRRDRKLNIDGFNAAGTYKYEYMHLLAHLPVLLAPSPDTVLVICFGTGTTCGTAALYPQVRRVECVEISEAVIASARYFSDVNHHATENPKVRITVGDGRNYLLRTRRRFDCITLEPMLPYMASATNLYSADFYRLCRSRLTERGVMAQWAPMHALSNLEYRMLIGTFQSVFPHTSLWVLGSEALLIGTMDSLRIDGDTLKQRMSLEAPAIDLAKISIIDPAGLLSCFIMDARNVREMVGKTPIISDDRHGLEFSVPHNRVIPLSRMWVANMQDLLRRRVSCAPFIKGGNDSLAAQVVRYTEASSSIMQAGIHHAQGQEVAAIAAADAALRLKPDDTVAKIIRQEAGGAVMGWYVQEARNARGYGDFLSAERAYLQALAVDTTSVPLLSELAELYIALDRYDKVVEYAEKAVASAPDDPSTHTNLAVVYLNLDRPDDAEHELLHAIALDGDFGRAYYILGSLYQKTGRDAEAAKAFRRVQELGYRE